MTMGNSDDENGEICLTENKGGARDPFALAVSQRRKAAGTLVFDDLEPFL